MYMKPFVKYDKLCEIYANDLAKGANAKGPRDQFEDHQEHSSTNLTKGTNQTENVVDSHSQQPCHGSNPSTGGKSTASRKSMVFYDDVFAVEFTGSAKLLKLALMLKQQMQVL